MESNLKSRIQLSRAINPQHMSDLQVMSHSRLHDLFEGVIDSSPRPAVDIDALHSKLDRLLRKVLVLQENRGNEFTFRRCVDVSKRPNDRSKTCRPSSPLNPPLYNAEPLWKWSAASACRSWLDACCRLWPDSSDTDTGFRCPPPRTAAWKRMDFTSHTPVCHRFHGLRSAYLIDISPELHQHGDGLSHRNSVVDVIALQTLLQLWQMPKSGATWHNDHNHNQQSTELV